MNTLRVLSISTLLPIILGGCASRTKPLDLSAMTEQYFADMDSCTSYVRTMVLPAAKALAKYDTPEQMRTWIAQNPNVLFSKLVRNVQLATANLGPIDPTATEDRIKLLPALFYEMEKMPGYKRSGCSADVREYLESALYLGIGAWDSRVDATLRQRGVDAIWERRSALLISLMASSVRRSD